jgi:hypothetical protein
MMVKVKVVRQDRNPGIFGRVVEEVVNSMNTGNIEQKRNALIIVRATLTKEGRGVKEPLGYHGILSAI